MKNAFFPLNQCKISNLFFCLSRWRLSPPPTPHFVSLCVCLSHSLCHPITQCSSLVCPVWRCTTQLAMTCCDNKSTTWAWHLHDRSFWKHFRPPYTNFDCGYVPHIQFYSELTLFIEPLIFLIVVLGDQKPLLLGIIGLFSCPQEYWTLSFSTTCST